MTWHIERTKVRVWIVDENGNVITRVSIGMFQRQNEINAEKIIQAVNRLPEAEAELQKIKVWLGLYQKCLSQGHESVIMAVNGANELRCGVCGWMIGTIEKCAARET
jgi:S-adenosylmethionine hydrolase